MSALHWHVELDFYDVNWNNSPRVEVTVISNHLSDVLPSSRENCGFGSPGQTEDYKNCLC